MQPSKDPGPRGQAHADQSGQSSPFSRGTFLKGSVGVAAGLAVGAFWDVQPSLAKPNFDPNPIPGGFDENFNLVPINPFIHVLPPSVGFEMSTITDFKGVVAAAQIRGTATGSDGSEYSFDADMRFMHGRYIATDGRMREKTFAFI